MESNQNSKVASRREETTQIILDAAEKLFAERGYSGISVRDIGREADVSHALVHRYLGSKREIYLTVLRRNENAILQAAGDTDDLRKALSLMLREGLRSHRTYLRIIAHSALSGMSFDDTMGRFPATERLVQIAQEQSASGGSSPALDVRFVIAAIVSLYVGWAAIEDWIVPATGLSAMDEDAVVDNLEQVIIGMADCLLRIPQRPGRQHQQQLPPE